MIRRMIKTLLPAAFLLLSAVSVYARAESVGDPRHPELLQSTIEKAITGGAENIRITPGLYLLSAAPSQQGMLTFKGLENVTIDAPGVTLCLPENVEQQGVVFQNCTGVTFRGAVMHYQRPQTGQGKILDMGRDSQGTYYDIRLDRGYPQDADFKAAYIVDPKTKCFQTGTWDMGAKKIVPLLGKRKERVYWDGSYGLAPDWHTRTGDYLVCRGKGSMMLHADTCTHCTFEDLTIYWGAVFGYFDTDSTADRYLHDRILFGPKPAGADTTPMLSQSADGMHCADDRVGPDVEDCLFEGMPDDGIAIHGSFALVEKAEGSSVIVGTRGGPDFRVGDPFRTADNITGYLGSAQVVSIAPESFTASQNSRWHAFDHAALTYYKIGLDKPLTPAFDALAWDPAACGAGYRLIGNTIRCHRARGMLLKADDGLVKGNTIDGSTIAAIVVSPEAWWGEAGYCHNVTIEDNTIRYTGYATNGPWSGQAAALCITGDGAEGNENIVVKNNSFENIWGPNLIVQDVKNAVVTGNRFLKAGQVECVNGRDQGVTPGTLIWLDRCDGVTLLDNKILSPGKYMKQSVAVTKTALNVKGLKSGVLVKN